MAENLHFSEIYFYNTLKVGITVPAILQFNDLLTEVDAKIDTGATFCIFERRHGEHLSLDIETGYLEKFSTATGYFTAYGHELKLTVLGIETVSTVYFAAEENFTRNVLGRQGWLDRVKFELIDYEAKLLISAYGE